MYNTEHKIVPVGVDGVVLHFECGGFKPEVIVIDNMTPSDGFLYHQIYASPFTTNPSPDGFIPAHDFKVLVAPDGKKNFTVAIQPVAAPTGREYVDVIISDDPRYYRMFHQTNLVNVSVVDGATEATLATRASEATLAALAAEDFATQTTLATRASEATLATLAGKDFATQTTLAALLAAAATEATLATRASEATLAALAAEDFATQTTLATRASEATLATLAGKDFATQATLAALLAAAATEATLASVATKLDTLITAMGTANGHLAAIKTNTDRIP